MIHQYAVVDADTLQVIGKEVSPIRPRKMADIDYTLTLPDGTEVQGKAFLSKAVKYWEVVSDPGYLVQPGVQEVVLVLGGV